jgi:archaellum biogenesis ATPase FlaH
VQLEKTILTQLLRNENYTRKVLPFLKPEYFIADTDRILYTEIQNFISKYNTAPTRSALKIEIDALRNIKEDQVKAINDFLDVDLRKDADAPNEQWLIDSTEKFCQEKALYHAIKKSIEIMDNKDSTLTKGAIPSILSDALAISFDPNVGHDYLDQAEERYDYYHRVEEKLPFDLDFFNKITKNGVSKKTLNMLMGGVHTGKTLFLCHFSAAYLALGYNVLYITLEMAQEEISRRIDCNLMNLTFEDLNALPKDMYMKKIDKLKVKTNGKLIVKEYPATTATVHHFKALLNELNLKKNFVPDVIMIDYINLCASSRLKASSASDLYTWVKSISEEVRGLAQQTTIPIWSATQLNRSGFSSSDPDMTNTSESFGLPATVDFLAVLIATDDLKALNQIMVKQLKNRYEDMEKNKRFVVGVDRSKMKLYDCESTAQADISESGQEPPQQPQQKSFSKDKFKGLKV